MHSAIGAMRKNTWRPWADVTARPGGHYVMATNETHSVREFVQTTFALLDLDWEQYVDYDQRYERPTEVDLLAICEGETAAQLGT